MTLSEAIRAVRAIVSAYPNGGNNAGDGYIGALAAVLGQYPRQVALRCADPVHGVARETKFLPTVADLVAWCERETAPLHRDIAREERIAAQLKARDEITAEKDPRLLAKCKAWLDRSDPHARLLLEVTEAEKASRMEATRALIQKANQEALEREYRHAGKEPQLGMSLEFAERWSIYK